MHCRGVLTYTVTNFLPKLIGMLLFSMEKTEFPFFIFPIFGYCQFRPGRIPNIFRFRNATESGIS